MDAKPLVVHIVSGDLWAGAEVQACALIQGLAAMTNLQQAAIVFNTGMLERTLSQAGIPTLLCDESAYGLAAMITKCWMALGVFRPQIVHLHGFKENFVGGIAARLRGVKAVVRTHHGRGMIGVSRLYNLIERFNAHFLTEGAIAVSHELAGFLMDFGIPGDRIAVIHNGIEPLMPVPSERMQILKTELHIPPGAPVIGTVGRLVPVKDHETLLEAARLILERDQEVWFVLVGDGPLRERLEGRAQSLGIAPRVCFTGFRQDAADLMHLFDIFALTSRHEGVPMALLEAMSLGKAVVATAVGGVPEVVEERITGMLVPSGDAQALAATCLAVLMDRGLRDTLSTQAKEAMQAHYGLSAMVTKTADIYRRILAQ